MLDWTIQKMEVKLQEGSYADVVVTAYWCCSASDQGFVANQYGSALFPAPTSSFTPYPDLTQEQVLGWVWQTINKAQVEEEVERQLNQQINPPLVPLPLPW
jgi:hypothetical protein